jgi:hypothetical protein
MDEITHVDENIEAVGKGAHGGMGVYPVAKKHERPDTAHVPETHWHHAASQTFRRVPLKVKAAVKDERSHPANDVPKVKVHILQ